MKVLGVILIILCLLGLTALITWEFVSLIKFIRARKRSNESITKGE